jgi:hypothetical protein
MEQINLEVMLTKYRNKLMATEQERERLKILEEVNEIII